MTSIPLPARSVAKWRDYLELGKPRVVALMLVTAIVGMLLASPGFVPWQILFAATVGIGLIASSAAAINHLVEHRSDALMGRTERRPLPAGRLTPRHAFTFALILGGAGAFILIVFVNLLTAALTLATLIGYAGFYTLYLKRATPQNIVIGGAAGAAPPLLGWTAVTGHFDPQALLLVLIIFTWTPPHFWALAIARCQEYAKAKIPMLPVTHGIRFTTISILLYTILLTVVTLLPFIIDMSGLFYLIIALVLNAFFIYFAIKLLKTENPHVGMQTFRYSILYLAILFLALLIDHYLMEI